MYADGDPIYFTLDDTPEYEGFAHGSKWNGFDNVFVTLETHEKVLADLRAQAAAASADDLTEWTSGLEDTAALTFRRPDGGEFISYGWGFVAVITRRRDA